MGCVFVFQCSNYKISLLLALKKTQNILYFYDKMTDILYDIGQHQRLLIHTVNTNNAYILLRNASDI